MLINGNYINTERELNHLLTEMKYHLTAVSLCEQKLDRNFTVMFELSSPTESLCTAASYGPIVSAHDDR
jgi:hypothetical protein